MTEARPSTRPPHLPETVTPLHTSVYRNLEVSAERYPNRPALIYYGAVLTYERLLREVERLAGYLTRKAGVRPGDRVLLYMQNAPQFVISYYAILRSGAIVVPVSPALRQGEFAQIRDDTDAHVVICGQEMAEQAAGAKVKTLVTAVYRDYAPDNPAFTLPRDVAEPRPLPEGVKTVSWSEAIGEDITAPPHLASPKDRCLIAYTSGTTGHPKGCVHTNASVNAVISTYVNWFSISPASHFLASLPLFHVTGMQNSMNVPVFLGATIVLMTRWDRDTAIHMIERYRVSQWRSITTMIIDLLSLPDLNPLALASLAGIGGGGAAMPASYSEKLTALTGLPFIEGYGLTECMAATHLNPVQLPKRQCLGLPVFDVDSRIIDPATLEECRQGSVGEIIVAAPQLFEGYWRQPEATAEALLARDGKRFLRTGDLGYVDEDGYFFLVDRLKRMISVSGFKVWPAELEAVLHQHQKIREVCVVGVPDARRGEAVKALIVPRGIPASPAELREWCRARMAAYKVPSVFEHVESLPRSASGKIVWRELQSAERAAAGAGQQTGNANPEPSHGG